MDVFGVTAAYVHVVHCVGRHYSALLYSEIHTHNVSEYAAITPTTSMSTDTIEPFL